MITSKILLVGAGDFGRHYLRLLNDLSTKGSVELMGVCVASASSSARLKTQFPNTDIYTDLTKALEQKPDGVIIATPMETHKDLIMQCLQQAHVLVEKPVVTTVEEYDELQSFVVNQPKQLMVGQIFRFNPVTQVLKKLLAEDFADMVPAGVSGSFLNPADTDKGRPAALELNHWLDLSAYLFNTTFASIDSYTAGSRLEKVSLLSDTCGICNFQLGWVGDEKKRTYEIHFDKYGKKIIADYQTQKVTILDTADNAYESIEIGDDEPLLKQLEAFVQIVTGVAENAVPLSSVAVTTQACSAVEQVAQKKKSKPKIAVIGGGIFGANVAYELSAFAEVVVFERNDTLLHEGSRVNQYRHHMGYHYPRSDETVLDIQQSNQLFEERFDTAILKDVPTYYGIAKEGSLVSGAEFTAFCDKHKLPYQPTKNLPDDFINKHIVDTFIKVPEGTYCHDSMVLIANDLISAKENIEVRFGATVTDCTILPSGNKRLEYKATDTSKYFGNEEFDCVINTTYAGINTFAEWIGSERHPVRIDMAEVLIVKLPVEPVSLTVMDGPFATLMTTGKPNEFTLYHARESILDRYTPADGKVKVRSEIVSNAHSIMTESKKLFPILDSAEILESRIVNRGVLAFHEHDDARVADTVEHGFRCWSVLSGKIVSSVHTAQKLADDVRQSFIS